MTTEFDPDLSRLDAALAEHGADGYLLDADGEVSDQRYLAGFDAPDPFVTLYDGEIHLLVSSLEYGRARTEARADTVHRRADFDYQTKVAEHGPGEAQRRVLVEFLAAHDVDTVVAPTRFPLGTADGLRERDVTVRVERTGVVGQIRARKQPPEIEHVRTAQRANEAALERAETLLREADIDADDRLVHDGTVLTSERLKRAIETALVETDHALDETIVACGRDAADPHDRGSGPLAADEPIIIDVFPRGKAHGYHADMTRTFVKGDPDQTVRRWHDLTVEAQAAAFDALSAGAGTPDESDRTDEDGNEDEADLTGEVVHDAVCAVYEAADEPTMRADPDTETGFIHGTGHGVGLDVHEPPRLAPGGDRLAPGMVVTVEPGLYDPAVGGVRVEDLVVVRADGFENLTDYHRDLVIP